MSKVMKSQMSAKTSWMHISSKSNSTSRTLGRRMEAPLQFCQSTNQWHLCIMVAYSEMGSTHFCQPQSAATVSLTVCSWVSSEAVLILSQTCLPGSSSPFYSISGILKDGREHSCFCSMYFNWIPHLSLTRVEAIKLDKFLRNWGWWLSSQRPYMAQYNIALTRVAAENSPADIYSCFNTSEWFWPDKIQKKDVRIYGRTWLWLESHSKEMQSLMKKNVQKVNHKKKKKKYIIT
jgi:hypothetical protein